MKLERKEQILPAGPSGLPDLGYGSRFQAGYYLAPMWRMDGRGRGLLLKLQHQCLGHTGYAAAQGL